MASIAAALNELIAGRDVTVEDALTRHFTDSYRQSTNGEWIDRAAFGEQMTQLRPHIENVEITVLDEVSQGSAYAERHVIRVTQRGGGVARQEVFLFAQLADDGRFDSLEELVRPLPA
ncbi:hypothetical protein [Humibacter sp.]|uniref:hypothetical protein n=1 Tax=Humibacter sp. TaxID=1940291 RepID=UPI003F820530